MAACRKAKNTNSVWLDLPLFRPRSDPADRPLNVLHWGWMMEAGAAVPILQDESGSAERIKPLRDRRTLILSKRLVGATWTNNHSRSIGFFGGGGESRDLGIATARGTVRPEQLRLRSRRLGRHGATIAEPGEYRQQANHRPISVVFCRHIVLVQRMFH
jgi:hypothetical protein